MGDGVVVTGIGLVTALGSDVERVWSELKAGRDGTGVLSRFHAADYRVRRSCEVPASSFVAAGLRQNLMEQITLSAAREAGAGAGILPLPKPSRAGLILGTLGSADLWDYEQSARSGQGDAIDAATARGLLPAEVARTAACKLGVEGRVSAVLTACSAGNHAIALGRQWIISGRADVMFVGGADVITQTQYTHFHNLRALSPDVCRPFDRRRRGLVIGEGAGFLVLEAEPHARKRGARVLAQVLGASSSCEAYHMTAPEPTGEGVRRAIMAALKDASVRPGQVDYISAHGTGTPLNDRVEAQVVRAIFGPTIPVSSVKSMIGHCMGGASAIEAIVCILAIRDKIVPPTIHFGEADPECPVDCVPNEAREVRVRVALNNAFAFGGNNCIVVLGTYGA